MKAAEAILLSRELVQAGTLECLAGAFLRAICAYTAIRQGMCFWQERAGETLVPVAFSGLPEMQSLSPIALSELENPLVYGLSTAKPYLVARIDTLMVGAAFERLRDHLAPRTSLLVVPIQVGQHEVAGVMAFSGSQAVLESWQADPTWRELIQLLQVLMLRLQQQSRSGPAAQRQESLYQQRAAEKSRLHTTRMLAAGFIGIGQTARRLREDMLRLAVSSLSLLITGETGSGKDQAAWLIHQVSSREGKFVPVNCAAMPKDLIEAELFGATRGAYTGATQARKGLVAEADGGTLFLDEIGDMPLVLQGTLLRVLNEKKFRPIGATREQASDFRLICATHRPLTELVRDGTFREDLYFRIRQHVLHIPPLREHPEDIPALVEHLLQEHNRTNAGNVAGITGNALARLQAHAFPGNVRELRSLILAAAEQVEPGRFIRTHLLAGLEEGTAWTALEHQAPEPSVLDQLLTTDNLREALATFERILLRQRLHQVAGSRREAALSLGIPKRTLARKCLELNLTQEKGTR